VFLIALERGFLDSILDRVVVDPFFRVARLLTRLDSWLCFPRRAGGAAEAGLPRRSREAAEAGEHDE
jgi:hypothetical protein